MDVTVQAQVLEVLGRALTETGASLLLITHDLGIVAGMADRVAVMYAGRIVEQGPVDDFYSRPSMPYTLGLLGSVPRLTPGGRTAGADRRLAPRHGRPGTGLPVRPALPACR